MSGSVDFSSELKKRLIDILSRFLNFCDNKGLNCYGCGGTVLGAVRHKGFIPWDDDIDLYMKRVEYDRLILMNSELSEIGLKFICFENDKDYYLPFGKIVDMGTSLWEIKRFPYMLGVYIDIFPLDFFHGTNEEIEIERKKYINAYTSYQLTLECPDFRELLYRLVHYSPSQIWRVLKYRGRVNKRDELYDNVISYVNKYRNQHGDKCICVTQWENRVFNAEWFENSVSLPYENLYLRVPGDYDAYLTLLYGDYMTLPPIEKRLAAHGDIRYYTNLLEHISISEARKRIRNNETLVF